MEILTVRSREPRSFRSLYRTKFVVPQLESVPRPRLVELLERAAQRKLSILTAPAGWGKTSLLAEWTRRTEMSVVWVSFDATDREAIRFLRLIVEACEAWKPGLMADVHSSLLVPHVANPEQVFDDLFDVLSGIDCEIAIVLDEPPLDLPEIASFVDTLVRHSPANTHLLVASRAEFPLPVARMRTRGDVTELRMDDLRFTDEEIARFWNAIPDIAFGPEEVALSREITEGWAAGLSLAAMASVGSSTPRETLLGFGGAHRDVAEYLTEEVFATQSMEMQDFLIRTSLLDGFSASLCDEMLNRQDSQDVLLYLEICNPFLVPLDGEGRSYRYHGMFSGFLRTCLHRLSLEEITSLHLRAGRWYEREGCIDDAVKHFLAADAQGDVVRVLDTIAHRPVVTADETACFVAWASAVPAELLQAYPAVLRFYARTLTLMGRLDEARGLVRVLRSSEAGLSEAQQRHLEAESLAIESRIGAYVGDNQATIASAEQALALVGSGDDALRADLLLSLGFVHRGLGDLRKSTALFDEASRLGRSSGSSQAELWGVRYLAVDWVTQGRLADAWALISDELTRINQAGSSRDFARAALLVGRAELEYERNDLAASRESVEEALRIAQVAGDAKILMNAYVAQMYLDFAEGKTESSLHAILRAQRLLNGRQEEALHAGILLAIGNVAAARQWADASGFTLSDPLLCDRGSAEQVIFARIRFESGAQEDAIALLERLREDAEEYDWVKRVIQLGAVLAGAYQRVGDMDRAIEAIENAIRLAASERYLRSILEAGNDIESLIRIVLRRGTLSPVERAFALDIVLACARSDGGLPDRETLPLVEPLTDRQFQILNLLAAGRSNREIAAELFVAEGTVKAHVHQLYGKLMARNRIEAIANARQLGLILS